MQTPRLRRLAPFSGALVVGLSSVLAAAQDGIPPTGPPVTNPRTDRNNPAPPASTSPRNSGDVLPGVPATARDPAPPGTRAVRVDVPKAAPVDVNPNAASPNAANRTAQRPAGANARVLMAEGVVTRLDRAGKNVNGELERFAFDPSQDWNSYVNRGITGVPEKDADRPKTNAEIKAANEKQHEDAPDRPKVMEMVITKRTYVYTYARNADGTDLYGVATASSPETTSSRTGLTSRPRPSPGTANGPAQTNFTNIREGSFVAVRYRKVGDLNEVLNLTLIEMPVNPADGTNPNGTGTGTGPGNGTATSPGPARVPPSGTPARVPTVPLTPAGVEIPR